MWVDEIVEDVRRVRQEHAAQFGYDLDAVFRDLKQKERESNIKLTSLPPKQPISMKLPKSSQKTSV